VLLLLLSLLSLAGPVEDAQEALAAHGRGRDVTPLQQAASALDQAQAQAEAPRNAATYDLIASLHLAVAQDGPEGGRHAALQSAVQAASQARDLGGGKELSSTVSGIALLVTEGCRRARTPQDREAWRTLGLSTHSLVTQLSEPVPATLRGQLAQALAPLELGESAQTAAMLAQDAAAHGHPSRSLDVRVAEALVREESPQVAAEFLEQAVARWPTAWEIRDLAGGTAARQRQFEQAIAHFDAALEHVHPELTRQRAVLLRKRAAARTESGDLDGAIADFEAAEPLERADPTQRYLWGRTHVMAAQRSTNALRERTGNRAALPQAAQDHCAKAIPHLEAVQGDARLGAPATQALALCRQVVAAEVRE